MTGLQDAVQEYLKAPPVNTLPQPPFASSLSCQGHYPKLGCPESQRQVVEISNTESLVALRHTRARAIRECEVALDRAKVPPEKSED